MEFKRLFFINKKQLLEQLKNPEVNEEVAPADDVHHVYGELFESCSPTDNGSIQPERGDVISEGEEK